MDTINVILKLIILICKIVLSINYGCKFILGNKEKVSTLWYGLALFIVLNVSI